MRNVSSNAPNAARRKTPWIVGTLMLASLTILFLLQSTNLWRNLAIESSGDLLMLYALSSLNFIAFVIFAFIFLRSIVKLIRERRTLQLGAQIKTRLLIYFFAVSLLPIIAMAVFSYLFMNRALERWFTQIPQNVIAEARRMQQQSVVDAETGLAETAGMLAAALGRSPAARAELELIAAAGDLAAIRITGATGRVEAEYHATGAEDQRDRINAAFEAATGAALDGPQGVYLSGHNAAVAPMEGNRRLIVYAQAMDERSVSQIVESSVTEFERLKEKHVTVRQVGLATLGVMTFLLIFAASWTALYVARGLTTPIKALAEGAKEIAGGNLAHRVEAPAEDELELLIGAFNDMSARLESNSFELTEGRRYIETVIDALPTGVVSFDTEGRVTTINGSALRMLGRADDDGQPASIEEMFGPEVQPLVERLIVRARRVGHASDQAALGEGGDGDGTALTVSMTATALPGGTGSVLVMEDLSELIAAQRAAAWQEVARRMAHEIKNPLTPIQLSAERIAKRFAENGEGSNSKGTGIGRVVHESTATILREVTSLKTMVNEFSRFARLPDTRLEPGDLNFVIKQAAAVFDGRFEDIELSLSLEPELPRVELDAEQLKGVFVNLIENAVEAFDTAAADKRITVTTRHDAARDIVVAEVADSGPGIAKGDLQKLFQPYFSTKGRGTGLGLAIVSRVIGEHKGRVHVAANAPRGAKFILELPVHGQA